MNRLVDLLMETPPEGRFLSQVRLRVCAIFSGLLTAPGAVLTVVAGLQSRDDPGSVLAIAILAAAAIWAGGFVLILFLTWLRYIIRGV